MASSWRRYHAAQNSMQGAQLSNDRSIQSDDTLPEACHKSAHKELEKAIKKPIIRKEDIFDGSFRVPSIKDTSTAKNHDKSLVQDELGVKIDDYATQLPATKPSIAVTGAGTTSGINTNRRQRQCSKETQAKPNNKSQDSQANDQLLQTLQAENAELKRKLEKKRATSEVDHAILRHRTERLQATVKLVVELERDFKNIYKKFDEQESQMTKDEATIQTLKVQIDDKDEQIHNLLANTLKLKRIMEKRNDLSHKRGDGGDTTMSKHNTCRYTAAPKGLKHVSFRLDDNVQATTTETARLKKEDIMNLEKSIQNLNSELASVKCPGFTVVKPDSITKTQCPASMEGKRAVADEVKDQKLTDEDKQVCLSALQPHLCFF